MPITKQEVHAALADLAARYPQTFVLEKYQPHRPLRVGIAADLMERCPELDHHKLSVALTVYTQVDTGRARNQASQIHDAAP
jgi:sRNA-binding protein